MGIASALLKPMVKSAVKKADVLAPKLAGEMIEEAAPVATKSISGMVDSPLVAPRLDRTADLGVEPPLIAETGKDAFEALGMTTEKKDAWRSVNKKSQRSKLLPEIEDAAQQLSENKITSEQFRQLSKDKQPIIALDKVPEMPTYEAISGALTDSQVKKGIVGLNMKLPAGERVSSRLDIPAYNDYDTWVVSLHDGSKKSGAAVGYAKTAVLRNVEFVSDPKVALDIARRKPLASGGRMGKATIARIFGDWVPHNPDNAKVFAEKIFKDPQWTQVGMNPYRASYFYDKADGLPVTFADEVVQIGPLVMAKNVKKTTPDNPMFKIDQKQPTSPTFAEGGAVAQTDNMLADGGVMEEGGTVDPVSGNDVPAGSLKEEVRDDVEAQLSVGEFVLPADVVRYIGLEKLMKIRDAAKEGLKRMEEVGQMGNAEEAPKADESFAENDDEFEGSIDEIMSEVDDEETTKMAAGGFVTGAYKEGMKTNTAVDVRYFKHADGRVIYVTYINGKPMVAIPEGFTQTDKPVEQKVGKVAEETAAAVTAAGGGGGGGGGGSDGGGAGGIGGIGGGDGGGQTPSFGGLRGPTGVSFDENGVPTLNTVSDKTGKMGLAAATMAMSMINPIAGLITSVFGKSALETYNETAKANFANAQSMIGMQKAQQDDTSALSDMVAAQRSAEQSISNISSRQEAQAEQGTPTPSPEATYDFTAEQPGTPAPDTTVDNSFTPSDSPSSNTPSNDSGFGTGDSYGNSDYGGYLNKGGFISKKIKSATKAKKGLASR